MTLRWRVTAGRALPAAVCLVATTAFPGAMVSGCESDDDLLSPGPPAGSDGGDARAATDTKPSDGAVSEARAGDAGTDATVSDAAVDATVADRAAGGPSDANQGVTPVASFSPTQIDFGAVGCGGMSLRTLAIQNSGSSSLVFSAVASGASYTVSPGSASLAPGTTVMLTVTAKVASSAKAGDRMNGSVNLFTNDPHNGNVAIPLSATATGAFLAYWEAGQTSVNFPTTKVGTTAPPVDLSLVNNGNGPATVALGAPSNSSFSLEGASDAGVTLGPSSAWTIPVVFTPPGCTSASTSCQTTATSAISVLSGTVCGGSLSSVAFQGAATTGQITGWPSAPLDFGPANCGGAAPAAKSFTLHNSGSVDAVVSPQVTAPFSVNPGSPQVVPANGGTLDVVVTPPPFPAQTGSGGPAPGQMPHALTGTLTLTSDANQVPPIVLSEEPSGASLAFDTTSTGCTTAGITTFSDFGSSVILQPAPGHQFCVTNTLGTAPAAVSLSVATGSPEPNGDDDEAAAPPQTVEPFRIATATFPVPSQGKQSDLVFFAPATANANRADLVVAVDPRTVLCAPLPQPLALSGIGIGAGPAINPTGLTFAAPCDDVTVPADESFTVTNAGTLDMNWSMSGIVGSGAARYTVRSVSSSSTMKSPQPGLLHPGESSTVTVGVNQAMPFAQPKDGGAASPTPTPDALAARLTVTTDVPLDSPHVVSLAEVPLGDQLSLSLPSAASSLEFGQFPIGISTSPQTFAITSSANAGSLAANVVVAVQGPGASAYQVMPGSVPALAPGAGANESAVFTPASTVRYPATISLTRQDPSAPLCAPLPAPIVLDGMGTNGVPVVSPTVHDFGLVPCGATGQPQPFVVSNQGNQVVHVTQIQLGKSASANPPFTLKSLPPLPAALGLSGTASDTLTFVVAPNAIPSVSDPNDPTVFSDVLTVTTDATGDSPHAIPLTMQAQGAVITAPLPLPTSWAFGSIAFGSITTSTAIVGNTGNAPATVSLVGVQQPRIFGLAGGAATILPKAVSSVVGQFAPPTMNGSWTDQGTFMLAAPQGMCAPPPAPWQLVASSSPPVWQGPTVALSGSSTSDPPVTESGLLNFGSSECGGAPPAAQSITLTNNTNQVQTYTASLQLGVHYTLTTSGEGGLASGDAGAGTLAPKGSATLLVTPKNVTPGPGVVPGSAPYADSLFVSVAPESDGGNPASIFATSYPIVWSLNGAVLSLPQGLGPATAASQAFYVADSTSTSVVPVANAGNEAASVFFSIQPQSTPLFAMTSPQPASALAGLGAQLALTSTAAAPACQAQGSPNGSITLTASGPICDFSNPAGGAVTNSATIQVLACSGTR